MAFAKNNNVAEAAGIRDYIRSQADDAAGLLARMIGYPSTLGNENGILSFLHEVFSGTGARVERVPILESIADDADYSFADAGTGEVPDYRTKSNLVIAKEGSGGGRSLILQTHVDVVPAEEGWADAFTGRIKNGKVYGRGACDCKGQIVLIFLALKALQHFGVELQGRLTVQLVVEEEIGGNGALSLIKQGHAADGVVVFEPTGLQIHPANRGALWFRITVSGRSAHMGKHTEGVNSIDKAIEAIRLLKEYEKRLLEESKGYNLFERYEFPVQLNVGMISGGILPSMVPGKCAVEGGVGFLPNKSMEQIKTELRNAVSGSDDDWLRDHFQLEFPRVHNDSYEMSANHPLPQILQKACHEARVDSGVFGWNTSCDARLYARRGNMPVVVFGAGDVGFAHSTLEHVDMEEVLSGAYALTLFLIGWCGRN